MKATSKIIKNSYLTNFIHYKISGVTQKSYYDILGVPKSANLKTIKAEFLKKGTLNFNLAR